MLDMISTDIIWIHSKCNPVASIFFKSLLNFGFALYEFICDNVSLTANQMQVDLILKYTC